MEKEEGRRKKEEGRRKKEEEEKIPLWSKEMLSTSEEIGCVGGFYRLVVNGNVTSPRAGSMRLLLRKPAQYQSQWKKKRKGRKKERSLLQVLSSLSPMSQSPRYLTLDTRQVASNFVLIWWWWWSPIYPRLLFGYLDIQEGQAWLWESVKILGLHLTCLLKSHRVDGQLLEVVLVTYLGKVNKPS